MSQQIKNILWLVVVVLIALPLLGMLDQVIPAQGPAAMTRAEAPKPESPKPLSDADARAFQRLQVIVLESRVTLASLETEFNIAKDRHDQAVQQIQELLSRLRKQYQAEGCDLGKELDWVDPKPDPVTRQIKPCTPSRSASPVPPEKPKPPVPVERE